MDEEDTNCIICESPLSSGIIRTVNQQESINTFINASYRRQDLKYRELKKFRVLRIHESCAKSYTSELKIQSHLRRLPSTSRSTRLSGSINFDFKSLCLFCGEDASDDFIRKQKKQSVFKRKQVSIITNDDTRLKILQRLRDVENMQCIEIYNRISNVENLVERGARYHEACKKNIFNKSREVSVPKDTCAARVAKLISEYVLENKEECQFSMDSIIDNLPDIDEVPSMKYLKVHLKKIFGDEIIIHSSKYGPIITFANIGEKILTENWYKNKSGDSTEERKRIVKAAGKIILEDIRSKVYDYKCYPAPESFLESINDDVPETLKLILDAIILTNKIPATSPERKVISIAHAIISAARPRSFSSCIQLGLAAMLDKKYGSKDLLRTLSSLGFCASYENTQLFQASILHDIREPRYDNAYFQFVFDNADHNVCTIDGYNTFHVMGGIEIITPENSVSCNKSIEKVKKKLSQYVLGQFGKVPLQNFHKPSRSGMQNIIVQDLNKISPMSLDIKILPTDFLWISGKIKYPKDYKGWSGFMESITTNLVYEKSKINFFKFVNAPASNYDTIYTVLLQAKTKCELVGQKDCFVTFDQPLYYKAREIVECCNPELASVNIRLGGFHLLMSFMGSIGYIMNGSGLKEVLCQIYAAQSVEKILPGHAYARAVRGHILTHLALAQIIYSFINFNDSESALIEEFVNINENTLENVNEPNFLNIFNKFLDQIEILKGNGPTAKLWIQYFDMVTIMKQFIAAERSGNWKAHLESIRKMLPFFHASGHFLYAKSCHLYLQDMYKLHEKMDASEFHKFTSKGYFTIRRTDKFWSGVWSDMAIEQILMRSIHTRGGLTHGRGTTDSVLTKWILTMPTMIDITEAIEKFCNVSFATSEQHVDCTNSRILRDSQDLDKLIKFFDTYNPFSITDNICSITSGMKGNEKINCHEALKIGTEMMLKIIGSNYNEIKFLRKNRVTPLQAIYSMKIGNEEVIINPQLIFQRLVIAMEGKGELKNFFAYELAPFPVSIFDNGLMRKTDKSKLYDYFEPVIEVLPLDCCYVIDGGFLLHKVTWQIKENFNDILNRYVSYVQKYYSINSYIIFDGYPDNVENCIKTAERQRRQSRVSCADIDFDVLMPVTVSQEKFLSNDRNKNRLIRKLREKLTAAGYRTEQAFEDADTLIVSTAICEATATKPAVIVAEDIDVLVIFIQTVPLHKRVYFLKPSRGKVNEKMFGCNSFIKPPMKHLIGFIHAFTGCDTTSAFYNKGKSKIIKELEKNTLLIKDAEIFNSPNACHEDIAKVGKKIIAAIYAGKKFIEMPLNELRYTTFKKSSSKTKFYLGSLPPTESAAVEHSYRVYCQVQQWLGHNLDPKQWGWRLQDGKLVANYTKGSLIPDNFLKDISCKCLKDCTKTCGCYKQGLRCSEYCLNCHGQTCKNHELPPQNVDLDLDIDEELDENELIDASDCVENELEEYIESDIDSENDIDVNDSVKNPSKKARIDYNVNNSK